MTVLTRIQQIAQANRIRRDWLGEGGHPVTLEDAQHRADICLKCPHNYQGPWLWNMATSLAIASQMRLRETMAIRLEGEDRLKVCELCGCQLRLKLHVPFHHIYRHMSLEQLERFPTWCWLKQELGKKTQS